MCGIAGTVDFSGRRIDQRVLVSMAAALRHRGPDDTGLFVDGCCGLAHTRLAILDPEASRQPMTLAGRGITLSYNGELYGFRGLRERLRASGARFRTAGDTEVLLWQVAARGVDGLAELDGMFAFSAWSEERQELLLARDPWGIKPLFWTRPRRDLLVFASEIKALWRHPDVEPVLRADGLRQTAMFRTTYGTQTLYRGIHRLAPGTVLVFGRGGLQRVRFAEPGSASAGERERLAALPDDEVVREGRERFTHAVRRQLVADVPVGCFLSGGIDSSLVASAMCASFGPERPLETFTVGFEDDSESELCHARAVARALGVRNRCVLVSQDAYIELLARATDARDTPLSEPAEPAVVRMSEVARESVKVVLTGEGADELFAGYPKYRFAEPWSLFLAGARVFDPVHLARLAERLGLSSHRFLRLSRALRGRTEHEREALWFSGHDRAGLDRLFPRLCWSSEAWRHALRAHRRAHGRLGAADELGRMQGVDLRLWLPDNLLESVDRLTMQAGLEARIPFLDPALAGFALALSRRHKIVRRRGKHILRRWAAECLPRTVVERPKHGFRVPLAAWFRSRLGTLLREHVHDPGSFVNAFGDACWVERLLAEHRERRMDWSGLLWSVLALELWYVRVPRGPARPSGSPALVTVRPS